MKDLNQQITRRNFLAMLSTGFAASARAIALPTSSQQRTPLEMPTLSQSDTWNIKARYGTIDRTTLQQAVNDAAAALQQTPDRTLTLELDPGTYQFDSANGTTIDFHTLLPPTLTGRLIITGAGLDETTLVFTDNSSRGFSGTNVNNLTLRDMHLTRAGLTVSQGVVASVSRGSVVLDIDDGFPSPMDIYDTVSDTGRYLRRYLNPAQPMIDQSFQQIIWNNAAQIAQNRWSFTLKRGDVPAFSVGDLVGIKSKEVAEPIWFSGGGGNLEFRNLKWTRSTRVLLRGGPHDVLIKGCRIERDAPVNGHVPCLASAAGGPQLNHSTDPVSRNMFVEDCMFDSAGDDLVAFFNVNGGHVLNSILSNGFARGILIEEQCVNICKDAATQVINCPIKGTLDVCG